MTLFLLRLSTICGYTASKTCMTIKIMMLLLIRQTSSQRTNESLQNNSCRVIGVLAWPKLKYLLKTGMPTGGLKTPTSWTEYNLNLIIKTSKGLLSGNGPTRPTPKLTLDRFLGVMWGTTRSQALWKCPTLNLIYFLCRILIMPRFSNLLICTLIQHRLVRTTSTCFQRTMKC